MKLIYITGIDGCGKTTQSELLAAHLNESGGSAQYQWLRWSPSIGKIISVLKKRVSKEGGNSNEYLEKNDADVQSRENDSFNKWSNLKAKLFSLEIFKLLWLKYASWDYYYAYKKAASGWQADTLVLDRYYFDFVVDQSLNYGEGVLEFEERVSGGVLKNIKKPDVIILIDITPQVGWERKRDGTSLAHLQKLHKAYKSLQASEGVYVVNGAQTMQSVHIEIRKIITEFMGKNNAV